MQLVYKSFVVFLGIFSAFGLLALTCCSPIFSNSLAFASISLISLASVKPHWAIAIFLFLLPVFGNKPGTLQANYLLVFGLALQFGLTISVLRKRVGLLRTEALAPAFWYLIISALSIVPVSFKMFWGWLRASQTDFANLSLLKWNLASVLLAREDDPYYPVFSVFWTALAYSLSYFIYYFGTKETKTRSLYCWALFWGFICSLIVGLLNYYGYLSLVPLRELDPVVNPGGTQYRLQSWFGHSGWYAEYVTMLAPFAMLVLTLAIPYWTRVSVLLLLLLIGEIVLILTFQRGGWLSYPLTLLAVWTSIYVLRRLDKGATNIFYALKSSALKILISLPLTLLISFLILKTFGSQFGLDQYADRFKDIAKTSDRTEFIKAGFQLGALNPVLGQGSESFALQYRREYRKEDGAYSGQIDLPLHGTAHNLYAQTFAGKGALGLLGLLIVMLVSVRRGARYVLSPASIKSRRDQVTALVCLCSILACFIYGFVQELFYVQSLQYVFFSVVGILASLPVEENQPDGNKKNLVVGISLIFLFGAHILYNSRTKRPYSDVTGCYQEESNQIGENWRWCGLRSSIDLPSKDLENKTLTLEAAPARGGLTASQKIKIESCNQVVLEQSINSSQKISFPVKLSNLNCGDSPPGFTRFNTYYGNYFIPAKESKVSTDRRVLAIRWVLNK